MTSWESVARVMKNASMLFLVCTHGMIAVSSTSANKIRWQGSVKNDTDIRMVIIEWWRRKLVVVVVVEVAETTTTITVFVIWLWIMMMIDSTHYCKRYFFVNIHEVFETVIYTFQPTWCMRLQSIIIPFLTPDIHLILIAALFSNQKVFITWQGAESNDQLPLHPPPGAYFAGHGLGWL